MNEIGSTLPFVLSVATAESKDAGQAARHTAKR